MTTHYEFKITIGDDEAIKINTSKFPEGVEDNDVVIALAAITSHMMNHLASICEQGYDEGIEALVERSKELRQKVN